MSLYDTCMDFRTIYRLEYTPKRAKTLPFKPPEDSNPISFPYVRYLIPDESFTRLLPEGSQYEDPYCVLHRAHELPVPDLEVIANHYRKQGQTKYQAEHCKLGDYESNRTRMAKTVPLPPGWIFPLTTHRCGYRPPESLRSFMTSTSFKTQKTEKQKDNLTPIPKEREILQVKTGESDYMANIGQLGEFIIREKLYGDRVRKTMSPWEVKRRLDLLKENGIILP